MRYYGKNVNRPHRPAVVLVLTLVILVVLSVLACTLAVRVAAQRHRDQYMIDYQGARYACDSALKYALTRLQSIDPNLILRADKPDFSDLFALTQEQYHQMLDEWAQAQRELAETTEGDDANEPESIPGIENLFDANSFYNDPNALGQIQPGDANEPNVPGPYGPAWPLVAEPIELELGAATATIQVEDENAKMPISWAVTGDKKLQAQTEAALETFCEWMQMEPTQIDELQSQLEQVTEIKQFKLDLKPVTVTEKQKTTSSRRRTRSRRGRRARARTRTTKRTRPASAHATDFAKLFHSSLIDTEALARPVIQSPDRAESALKYLGMWGSKKVNINTAPRHVLEAAFAFGGDAVEIAELIIEKRQIKPFKNLKDLEKSLRKYADSIRKTKKYITTKSTFFTIRVTALCGLARTSAVVSIIKDGKKVEKLAVLFE